MAISGFVMVGFLFVHMLGNLNMFKGPDAINEYAHFLQALPPAILWGSRGVLIFSLILHVWMAIVITRENRAARPEDYIKNSTVQASRASKTMGITGSVILFFVIFHILHYTMCVIIPEYGGLNAYISHGGKPLLVHDVYSMLYSGFSVIGISIFYIIAMALLCMHLSHAVSSMFQTMGWRNKVWRKPLDRLALIYGWVIFLGFISVPVAVLSGCLSENENSLSLTVTQHIEDNSALEDTL